MKYYIETEKIEWNTPVNVNDERGKTAFRIVPEKLNALSHTIKIYSPDNILAASAKDEKRAVRPKFYIRVEGSNLGTFERKISLGAPKYKLPYDSWNTKGRTTGKSYSIVSADKIICRFERGVKPSYETDEEINAMEIVTDTSSPARDILVFVLIELVNDINHF